MSFAYPPDIGSYVISSPAHLVGDLKTDDLKIDHQWPDPSDRNALEQMFAPGTIHRYRFVVSCRLAELELPDGSKHLMSNHLLGRQVAILASLWFGKSFSFLGAVYDFGQFFSPRTQPAFPGQHKSVPAFSDAPRRDLGIELNWATYATPLKLLTHEPEDKPELTAFWNAARLYNSALSHFENDSEVAYFLLVSALECVAAACQLEESDLFDRGLLADLKAIEFAFTEGKEIVNRIKGRLHQIRRKVAWLTTKYLNRHFFQGSESHEQYGALTPDDFPAAILNAYDLRSKYAHRGAVFSLLVEPHPQLNNEKLIGDAEMWQSNRVVGRLPKGSITFLGLERLTRFVILAFCNDRITELNDKLQTASPASVQKPPHE